MVSEDPYGYPSQSARQRTLGGGAGPYGMGNDMETQAQLAEAMDKIQAMLDEQKRRMAEQQAQAGGKSGGGGGGVMSMIGGGGSGGGGGGGMGISA